MASNIACVGLPLTNEKELRAFLSRVINTATVYVSTNDLQLARWEDPCGTRITFLIHRGQIMDWIPTFAAPRFTRLTDAMRVNDSVILAQITDESDELIGALAMMPEQAGILPMNHPLPQLDARVVFLGNDVSMYSDEEHFLRSPASFLDPNSDPNEPPPASALTHGMPWPPRIGPESFFPYGTFSDPTEAHSTARFAGKVITAERHVVAETGGSFITVEVDTVGLRACVCLPGGPDDPLPRTGQIMSGYVSVVGSFVELETPPRN